jgi:hypothetical protein
MGWITNRLPSWDRAALHRHDFEAGIGDELRFHIASMPTTCDGRGSSRRRPRVAPASRSATFKRSGQRL